MRNVDLGGTLNMLKGQRTQLQRDLAKLEKAIAVLGELSGAVANQNGHSGRRILSAAARKRIADAQRLRWAKVRQAKAAKTAKG